MKQKNFLKLLFLLLTLTASNGFGQIASWVLTSDGNASGVHANISASAFTSTGTGTLSFGSSGAFANGWSTGAIDTGKYFEITVTPNSGFEINITDINFGERRSGTGMRDYQVRWSIDDFASDNTIATVNVPDNTSERVGDISGLNIDVADGETLKIRWYGYNAEASGGTWRINNSTLNLEGSVSASSPVVGFDSASSSVNETNGTVNTLIPITMSSHDGNQVDLSVAVTGGTAEMADYTLNTTSLSFTGDGSQNVSLDINSDAGFTDETVILTITETSSVAGLVISQATHTVTINDDESPPTIGFDSATSTENETDATFTSANIPITVSGYDGNQIDINVNVTGGTAEVGDYTFTSPTSLSFTSDSTQNITFQVNDDGDSSDETIIFTITETSSVTGLVISQATHTVTINDDELPVLPTAGTVFITEIVDSNSDFNAEYIELFNNSGDDIDLSTSKLIRANGGTNTSEYVFDFGTDETTANTDATIPAYGFIIITRGATLAEFNTEYGITLDSGVSYNGGNSSLFFGTGRRWRLQVGGTANTDDGTLIDDTDAGVGIDRDIQNIFTGVFSTSGNYNQANPGELDYLVYNGGAWVNSTALDGTTAAVDAYLYDSFTVSANSAANVIGISSGQTLTINAGVSLTANGNLTNNGTLIINSTASLLVSGSATGNITYNVNVADTNWHLISAPVEGEQYDDAWNTLNSINVSGNLLNDGVSTYDNTTDADGNWDYFQTGGAATTFNTGQGYSLLRTAAGDYGFIGTMKDDDASIAITANDIGGGGENRWTLIGNPFPSYVSIDDFLGLAANATALEDSREAIYVWNGTAYVALTTGHIHPGQGFFVNSNVASTSVAINENMLSHQTGITFYRNASTDSSIELTLSDGQSTKMTEIKYSDGKTTGLDPRFDIGTFTGTSNSFHVYSHLISNSQGVDFMRQTLPNSNHENLIVPIGVNADNGTEITFTANALNIPNGLNVFIEDRDLGIYTQLDVANAAYTVTLGSDLNGIGRFYLHTNTQSALSTTSFDLSTVSIYKTSNTNLRIVGLQNGNASLSIFDILGKQVLQSSFEASSLHDITLPNVKTGVYIIRLSTDNGTLNKKIILNN
ncbi:T9SS type A sorting domain-containing protein [Flavobacteriaceae bacterium S356]|uniref:T9SS type A sorting domain-containing protein n=1 Tax=Asprobacillus argus TaxID=3076534 RepID=A0ABU3LIE9_9FLAO|nr:T9SS type A sorting domain-containing protein [Flavobacteriaceae bacterium S356]